MVAYASYIIISKPEGVCMEKKTDYQISASASNDILEIVLTGEVTYDTID